MRGLLGVAVLSASSVNAEPRLEISGALVAPLSDYADQADFGFGPLARLELPRNNVIAITIRGGALFHSSVDETLVLVPLYGGVRIAIDDAWSLEADAGFTYRYFKRSAAAVGLAFGAAYRRGRFHLGGAILVPDLGLVDSSAGLLMTVGYVTR